MTLVIILGSISVLLVFVILLLMFRIKRQANENIDKHNELHIEDELDEKQLKTMFVRLNEKVEDNRQNIVTNREMVTNQESKISQNKESLSANTTQSNELEKRVSANETNRNASSIQANELEKRVSANEETLDQHTLKLSQLHGEYNVIAGKTISLLDLAEFKTLDSSLKNNYKALIVEQMLPFITNYLNRYLDNIGLKKFLQDNELNFSIILRHCLEFLKENGIEAMFEDILNEFHSSQFEISKNKFMLHMPYILGTFTPALLERLNKQTKALKAHFKQEVDKSSLQNFKYKNDISSMMRISDNHELFIFGKKHTLLDYIDIEQNTLMKFLNEADIREVFSEKEQRIIYKNYINTFYNAVLNYARRVYRAKYDN